MVDRILKRCMRSPRRNCHAVGRRDARHTGTCIGPGRQADCELRRRLRLQQGSCANQAFRGAGGPREGGGGAVDRTTCACGTAMGTAEAPRGDANDRPCSGGGGRKVPAHKGQSMVPCATDGCCSSPVATHLMSPSAPQTIWNGMPLMPADAMDAPRNSTYHARTMPAMVR